MPHPHNGFRPDPLPRQRATDLCLCRSGKKYKRCCARLPMPPRFPPFLLWEAMSNELEDEDLIAAAASLQMPGYILLELARCWQMNQLYQPVLKLLEPIFRQLPKILGAPPRKSKSEVEKPIGEFLEPLLEVFVDGLLERGSAAKQKSWYKRLKAGLPEELHSKVEILDVL